MDKGTLFQLRNLLGRKQVSKKVSKKVSKNVFVAEGLLAVTIQGHVIVSAMEIKKFIMLENLHLNNGESICCRRSSCCYNPRPCNCFCHGNQEIYHVGKSAPKQWRKHRLIEPGHC